MGIDPSSINVTDLVITRPDRSGPGGDQVGSPTVVASGISACRSEEDRHLRRPRGRDVVSLGRFFFDPVYDLNGDPVEFRPGDLAQWTNGFGVAVQPQEIVSVEPIFDCDGVLDIVSFRVGQAVGGPG